MTTREQFMQRIEVSHNSSLTSPLQQAAVGGKENPPRPRSYEWARGTPSQEEKEAMHGSCLEWFSQHDGPIPVGTVNKALCRFVARHHADKDPRWYQFPDEMQIKDNLYWRHLKSQVHYYRK